MKFYPVFNLFKQSDIIALGFLNNSVFNLVIYDLSEVRENETGLKYSMFSVNVYMYQWYTYSIFADEPEEETHLLVRDDRGPWVLQPNVDLIQPKNKDIVTFEIKEPHDRYCFL